MTMHTRFAGLALVSLALGACQGSGGEGAVTAENAQVYDGIANDELLRFGGNEPFWGGQVVSGRLTYATPENSDGVTIAVTRFAGMNGLGFSGELEGKRFDMVVTPGECSDTMADRTYPFTITLSIADDVRTGCGWTDAQPFIGDENP